MKNDRLFRILYLLLEKGTVSAPKLAASLEVSVRTVYRDVEALSMAGVPVHAVAGQGGGVMLEAGYTFNRALLSDDEQDQILFAIQSLQATDQNVGMLLTKLGGIFRKPSTNWIEVDFSRWGFGHADNRKFDLIRNAILGKQVLSIRYYGSSGVASQRCVKPFKLVFKAKNWYLQAYCLKAEDYRLFKVTRILALEATGDTFQDIFEDVPPPDSGTIPMLPTECLSLLFTPAVAYRVFDEFDAQTIETLADGSLRVKAQLPADTWICGYLLTFGTEVTILSPEPLRAEMARYARRIAEHYET